MSAFHDIAEGLDDAIRIAKAAPALDQTTVRALCDAGYVTDRDYVALAAASGWQPDPAIRARAAELDGPPIDNSDLYA